MSSVRIPQAIVKWRRQVSIAGAALLLFGQLLAASHFHQFEKSYSAQAASHLEGLCAVCLLVSHAPAGTNIAPLPHTSLADSDYAPPVLRTEVRASQAILFSGRAPPRSI